MNSYQIHISSFSEKLKIKKENAMDTISKIFSLPVGITGKLIIHLNLLIMSTLKNKVQLIGNIGNTPEIKNLENGKTVANFSMATNDSYKNAKGEKVQDTQWHNIVAWNKTAEIIEKYAGKGKELAIVGKLSSRSYENKDGAKRYVTEIIATEVLLLGSANSNS